MRVKSRGMELEQNLELFAAHASWILSSFRGKGKPGVSPDTLMGRRKSTSGIGEIRKLARERAYEKLRRAED